MRSGHLPRSVVDLRGLRAARWVRESSAKQGDKYGPGAQRAMQDEAIARYGLVDTGLSWTVLKSGWSGADSMDTPPATKTADFQAMLRAAEHGQYDVLLVGYTSRFLRDVRLTLHYRWFFHTQGVAVLVCDDDILTSDPRQWEAFIDRVKADEQYSRTLGRNIRTGLAEKRRAQGDPGGQPPLGFRRESRLLVVDEPRMEVVRRVFALSSTGQPDHAVADATALSIDTVRHVLTNPIYVGRLSDGSEFRLGATIDLATWNLVADRRERRRTRVPGVAQRRCFPLKLTCGGCGAILHGHQARYRHPKPVCDPFKNARPTSTPVRGRHNATAGASYPAEWYEAVVERILEHVALTDDAIVNRVLRELGNRHAQPVDQVTLARIARARQDAHRRLEADRDIVAWQVTTARLDAEEATARSVASTDERLSEADIRAHLRRLASLWASSDPKHRQELALSLFDEIQVEGIHRLGYRWSRSARGMGIDSIVPSTLEVDLGTLGVGGQPTGTIVICSLDGDSTVVIEHVG